ncbi:MAG: DNA-processing protein DprA [Gammaproteobacteria bacterium]|nr:DNA-processing protein DprA [Gammaproteobacteria bacterium]
MSISPNTQAVLLLTAHFSKTRKETVKPLTPKEWGRFALWLKDKSLAPEQLMMGQPGELLNGWLDKTITLDRIEFLLDRGPALALATEKWLRAGLWMMTRSDQDYPLRLKKRMKTDSPALLFGCGNRALLNTGGLAVVGSRNAAEKDLEYSWDLGMLAAGDGYSIVSGGARGVDEAAMLGALEAEGTVIGVLADNLLRICSTAKYRKHLMANNLALISTFYPEAGFSAGNAMQRNKYIYVLSDAAMVVHSGEKGGTWNGALENVKKTWVPLWVKRTSD